MTSASRCARSTTRTDSVPLLRQLPCVVRRRMTLTRDGPQTQRSTRYYVDTRTRPPRSSWEHPLGPPASAGNFAPPPNPPPNRSNFGGNPVSPSFPSQQPQPQPYPGPATFNAPPSYGGGGFSNQDQQSRNFQPQPQYQQPPYGGPAGNYGNPGNPGWPQQGWQQPPPAQLGT